MSIKRQPIDTKELIKELKAGKTLEQLGVHINDLLFYFQETMQQHRQELTEMKKLVWEESIEMYKLTKKLDDGRLKALDVDKCAYENCYQEVYGVIQVPFELQTFNDDMVGSYYVNTPLCKTHHRLTPATEYTWTVDEKETSKE